MRVSTEVADRVEGLVDAFVTDAATVGVRGAAYWRLVALGSAECSHLLTFIDAHLARLRLLFAPARSIPDPAGKIKKLSKRRTF